MTQKAIMARHPAIFGKPLPNKYGRCPICNTPLVRDFGGPDTWWIKCPEYGHVSYLDEGDL